MRKDLKGFADFLGTALTAHGGRMQQIAAHICKIYQGDVTDEDKREIADMIANKLKMAEEAEVFRYLQSDCPQAQHDLFGDTFYPVTDEEPKSAILPMPGDPFYL